ncbi:MAG: hypothetical protein R3233_09140, partial [Xanthomonadales bacterium]|nr:hypothetical protein [Xanthomonadales bacterium]
SSSTSCLRRFEKGTSVPAMNALPIRERDLLMRRVRFFDVPWNLGRCQKVSERWSLPGRGMLSRDRWRQEADNERPWMDSQRARNGTIPGH